jgi:dolichyl-phosphate-mannose--protein O-mannosyl transferase
MADGLRIQEAAILGNDDELLDIAFVPPEASALFDEQHLVPAYTTFMNSTYFDENYYPRTAYEFLHALPIYERAHPHMGKNIIALSIKIFGMTPFAWRLPGMLFGILMIPLIYAFARFMFCSNKFALFAAVIFTFDFMHFTQTRIGQIETFVVFFVIAMFLFMYLYVRGVEKNSFKHSLLLLALCGLSMSLAISTKWQGLYGAVGLAILFFPALRRLYKIDSKQAKITIASCFGFFVLLPLVIYVLSYIPAIIASGFAFFDKETIKAIIHEQRFMFGYHSNLVAVHSFSSAWWTWPFNITPVFMHINTVSETVKQGISSFGNPAVWWFGIFATCYAIFSLTKKLNRDVIFILVAYAVQYIPWIFVSRISFLYYYFPSIPFVVLLITWFFKNHVKRPAIVYGYMILVVALFALFYPVLSGYPVSVEFVYKFLRLMPRWVLI